MEVIYTRIPISGTTAKRNTCILKVTGSSVDLTPPFKFEIHFENMGSLRIDEGGSIFTTREISKLESFLFRFLCTDSTGRKWESPRLAINFTEPGSLNLNIQVGVNSPIYEDTIPTGTVAAMILLKDRENILGQVSHSIRYLEPGEDESLLQVICTATKLFTLVTTKDLYTPSRGINGKPIGLRFTLTDNATNNSAWHDIWLLWLPSRQNPNLIQLYLGWDHALLDYKGSIKAGTTIIENLKLTNSNLPVSTHKFSLRDSNGILALSGTNIRTTRDVPVGSYRFTITGDDGVNTLDERTHTLNVESIDYPVMTVHYLMGRFYRWVRPGDVVCTDIRGTTHDATLKLEIISGGDFYYVENNNPTLIKSSVSQEEGTKKAFLFKVSNPAITDRLPFTSSVLYPEFSGNLPDLEVVTNVTNCPNPSPVGTTIVPAIAILNLGEFLTPFTYSLVRGSEYYEIVGNYALRNKIIVSSELCPEFQIRITTNDSPQATWTSPVMKPLFNTSLPGLLTNTTLVDNVPYFAPKDTKVATLGAVTGGIPPYTWSLYFGSSTYYISGDGVYSSLALDGDTPVQFALKVLDVNITTTSKPGISPMYTPRFGPRPIIKDIDVTYNLHTLEYEHIASDSIPICTININNKQDIGKYTLSIKYPYYNNFYVRGEQIFSFINMKGSRRYPFMFQIVPENTSLVNTYVSPELSPVFKDAPIDPDPNPNPNPDNILDIFNKKDATYRITKNLHPTTTITIPSGCTLDFQGGKIFGTVRLNGTMMRPLCLCPLDYISTIEGVYGEGQVVYNSSTKRLELWNGTSWVNVDGTPRADIRINVV